ncbi:MAG: prepilin-type N-terminal cleavage/methylation domain-containing protein [Candidatus Firestonebacteria bacterium]
MKKTERGKKGFTLLELIIAMGISFLLLLVLYYAYFLSQTFFTMGTDTIQEQMYVRNLFSKISEDLQFANRLNSLGDTLDDLEFEIFNREVKEIDSNSNDKRVEGNTIYYSTKSSSDSKYIILMKKVDKYEWWMKFGHSQTPNDDDDPKGYPDDMRDPTYGKEETESGEEEEVIEQVTGDEFLMSTIQFTPYDQDGKKIESLGGFDYSSMKPARSMRIEVEYMLKGDYGDTARLATRKKTATANILFISFSMLSTSTEETMNNPAPGVFNFYCLGDFPVYKDRFSRCVSSVNLSDFLRIK